SDGGAPVAGRALTDRWVLARLDEVVAATRAAWNDYDVTTGVRAIMGFVVDDLSNWYVRTNRPRFWAPDRAADPAALATLYEVLVTAARLLEHFVQRSEEHTSELQSQSNLVCRLLLE